MIKVHSQSSHTRVEFILLISVVRCVVRGPCTSYVGYNGKPRMRDEQKFCADA